MAKKITKQNFIEEEVKKEELVNFLDRHSSNWFIDTESNELKIGKGISDFLNKKTENFTINRLLTSDVDYWKVVETTDGRFVLLSRPKLLK
jgi:hypothetical protein